MKKLTIFISISIVLVAIWFFSWEKVREGSDTSQQQPKEGKSGQSQNIQQEISDGEHLDSLELKKYENKTIGFEIGLPGSWLIKEKQEENSVSFNSPERETVYEQIKQGKIYGEGYMDDITVQLYPSILDEPENRANNLNAASVEDFIKKNPLIINSKMIHISGEDTAWEMTWGGFGAYYVILIEKDTGLYKIVFGNKEDSSSLNSTEKKIIESLRFL